FIEGDEMVNLLEKISVYERIVQYLNRINIWEDIIYFMLNSNVKSADQFNDKQFLQNLLDSLDHEKLVIGHIRSCRWRPDCYEVDLPSKFLPKGGRTGKFPAGIGTK
ncbi:MAG: hypothetical protein ABR590_12270, partial [Spirochaetia bacterium]